MSPNEIDNILMINWYLMKCQFKEEYKGRSSLVRKYMTLKIEEKLFSKKQWFKNQKIESKINDHI